MTRYEWQYLIIMLSDCLMKQFCSIQINNLYWKYCEIILCSVHPATQSPPIHSLRCHSFILHFLVVCTTTFSLSGPFPENYRTSRIQVMLEFYSQTAWFKSWPECFLLCKSQGFFKLVSLYLKEKDMQISNLQLLWLYQEVICMQGWKHRAWCSQVRYSPQHISIVVLSLIPENLFKCVDSKTCYNTLHCSTSFYCNKYWKLN